MTRPPHAPSSLKPLQQISKPFCIRSLSLVRCPLRRKEKEKTPLIVRIKNNEEVRSYPSKVARALPFCNIKDHLERQKQAESLCGANDVASTKSSQLAPFFFNILLYLNVVQQAPHTMKCGLQQCYF